MRIPEKLWLKIGAAAATGATVTAAALFIGFHEGKVNRPYYDAVGMLTVCYGHTGATGIPVEQRDYSDAECQSLLEHDIQLADDAINRLVKVPLTIGQRIALQSFIFNLGETNFARSTLLKKLNAGDYAGAEAEFDKWIKAGNQALRGLVDRRNDEQLAQERLWWSNALTQHN